MSSSLQDSGALRNSTATPRHPPKHVQLQSLSVLLRGCPRSRPHQFYLRLPTHLSRFPPFHLLLLHPPLCLPATTQQVPPLPPASPRRQHSHGSSTSLIQFPTPQVLQNLKPFSFSFFKHRNSSISSNFQPSTMSIPSNDLGALNTLAQHSQPHTDHDGYLFSVSNVSHCSLFVSPYLSLPSGLLRPFP
ncbi:hypothetical protein C8R46DRAFT_1111861 [Mycena filopes]|nr:hypothetical protein C8R46DRAFT_1152905 [Mycena filopes]KAJ7151597.1 hypothetical protein C8R46DRAFT_1122535 [Mycena filopes]KAJ7158167.1 hypothetical protein C8R46DRAFT_1111861 [Mycena filopes]